MSYGSSASSLPGITDFKRAHDWFEKTTKPRSSKWGDNQRQLRNSRFYHYRIEKGDDYYDVCLYHTVMARFYAPAPDGSERKLYNGHNSMTSKQFMWHVLSVGHNPARITTEGINVAAPIYTGQSITDGDERFSAEFRFINNMLDVSRSMHTPHYRKVSNESDRLERANAKQKFEALVTLACMNIGEFADTSMLSASSGRPFRGTEITSEHTNSVKQIFMDNMNEGHINNFMDFARYAYEGIASKRGWNQGLRLKPRWGSYTPSPISDLAKPVTEKDLATSLHKHINDILGFSNKSGSEELPQFMPIGDYPRSNISTFSR